MITFLKNIFDQNFLNGYILLYKHNYFCLKIKNKHGWPRYSSISV